LKISTSKGNHMARKRKPGRPKGSGTTGIGTLIGVRAHGHFLRAVDNWRLLQQVPPARAAAVRRLAEIGLESERPRAARRPISKRAASKASQMAGHEIDRLSDQSVAPEERARRKRRLLKGPRELRELRDDLSNKT
jgi:hypothetical protein